MSETTLKRKEKTVEQVINDARTTLQVNRVRLERILEKEN